MNPSAHPKDALDSQPNPIPSGDPKAMTTAASALTAKVQTAQVLPVTVPPAPDAPPGAYDPDRRAVVQSLVEDVTRTGSPQLQALMTQWGVDPAQLEAGCARQAAAWNSYQKAMQINAAARDGRRQVGGARVLGRSVVKATVPTVRATLAPKDQLLLDDGINPILAMEAQEQQHSTDTARLTRHVQQQTSAQLQQLSSRRQLQQVLDGLAAGQTFDAATLQAAADTLDAMLPPDTGSDGTTPTSAPATKDRRDNGR